MRQVLIAILAFFFLTCNIHQRNNINPFQKIENYNGNVNLSIEKKLLNTPSKIIDFLNDLDNIDFYSSYELDNSEKQLFISYFEFLPNKFKKIIEAKVIGIYFINNFKGGGMTESVFDNNGNMYMVLFFNPEILKQNITQWIYFRDISAFNFYDRGLAIEININENYYGLIHTLFHEASHIYDFYNYVTPYTEPFLQNEKTKFPTEFVKNIWKNYNEPIEKYNFINREKIYSYDLGERIDGNFAIGIYESLKNTPFTSIYGSKTWAEDFAESFTWYYLKKFYGIKYITTLLDNEEPLLTYDPNENELVKARYKILEEIIE